MPWNCACCARVLPDRAIANVAVTEEGQEVDVGSDCIKKIKAAGQEGFQHNEGLLLFSLAAAKAMDEEYPDE